MAEVLDIYWRPAFILALKSNKRMRKNIMEINMVDFKRKAWIFVKSNSILLSTFIVAFVAFLGSIINFKLYLSEFGIVSENSLRVVSVRLNDKDDGSKELEILSRNIGEKPIVLTDLILRTGDVRDLMSCDYSEYSSALTLSGSYDVDISDATPNSIKSVLINQEIKKGESDRFKVNIDSNKIGKIYVFEPFIIYNESKETSKIRNIAVGFIGVSHEYFPNELEIKNLNGGSQNLPCYYYNYMQIPPDSNINYLEDSVVRNLLEKSRSFKGWMIRNLTPPEINELNEKFYATKNSRREEIKEQIKSEIEESIENNRINNSDKNINCGEILEMINNGFGSNIIITRNNKKTGEKNLVCNGSITKYAGGMSILTAAHCFFNAKTGRKMDFSDFRITLVDGSEFKISKIYDNNFDYASGVNDVASISVYGNIEYRNFNNKCLKSYFQRRMFN